MSSKKKKPTEAEARAQLRAMREAAGLPTLGRPRAHEEDQVARTVRLGASEWQRLQELAPKAADWPARVRALLVAAELQAQPKPAKKAARKKAAKKPAPARKKKPPIRKKKSAKAKQLRPGAAACLKNAGW